MLNVSEHFHFQIKAFTKFTLLCVEIFYIFTQIQAILLFDCLYLSVCVFLYIYNKNVLKISGRVLLHPFRRSYCHWKILIFISFFLSLLPSTLALVLALSLSSLVSHFLIENGCQCWEPLFGVDWFARASLS